MLHLIFVFFGCCCKCPRSCRSDQPHQQQTRFNCCVAFRNLSKLIVTNEIKILSIFNIFFIHFQPSKMMLQSHSQMMKKKKKTESELRLNVAYV